MSAGVPLLDRLDLRRKAELEDSHWWFRSRRRIVLAELARLPLPAAARALDAGCGSGALLSDLGRLGSVAAVDPNPRAVEHAQGRGVGDVSLAGVEALPFPDAEFDVVTCLDVLEHVADDRAALHELARVTRPGGFLLVTVPAYPALWSPHDVAAGHVRRYRPRELNDAAVVAGWQPVRATSFNTLLLPLVAAHRLIARARAAEPRSDLLSTPRALDALLGLPLRLEAEAIARGARLPVGLSRLAVFHR
jgi:SAM-dependent methyltransferase